MVTLMLFLFYAALAFLMGCAQAIRWIVPVADPLNLRIAGGDPLFSRMNFTVNQDSQIKETHDTKTSNECEPGFCSGRVANAIRLGRLAQAAQAPGTNPGAFVV
jgi:hypothetical protein